MTDNVHRHCTLILDFGSQHTQLVTHHVHGLGVYYELWVWDITEAQIHGSNPNSIILSGGPGNTTEESNPRASEYVFNVSVLVFGVCYDMQTMAMQLGGHAEGSNECEFGYAQVGAQVDSALVRDTENSLTADSKPLLDVWISHGDKMTAISEGFVTVASTNSRPPATVAHEKKRFYSVQFHSEVTHTRQGMRMLKCSMCDICQCEALWMPAKIIDDTVAYIREQVSNDKVILGLFDGVDSSATAILLHRAIGKNLTCVFVDNGLLRFSEAQQVMDMFDDHFGLSTIHVGDEKRFLDALKGENDPEVKRKIIGRVFAEVFDEEAPKLGDVKWLAQGTIYPDVIESAASAIDKAHVIRSHHNVDGLPKEMKIGLVESLRGLFKDEMRKIGLEPDLPYDMLYRHSFPRPGSSMRVLGEVRKEHCDPLRRVDAIFIEKPHKADLYNKVGQAFTVFLPVRSAGVMGSGRRYGWVVSLRAVEITDFMTTHWAHPPYDSLGRISNHIISGVDGISRMAHDISGKPPATIEWK